ncbi:MAG: hypothetical protein Q9184_000422 [Pyrenodesmia sp. 2 TL-2023]
MRRTLVSRKARKKRIAQNAEMNGENFYARQNMPPAAPVGARAETPPPLTSQPPSSMVNGAPGGDRLPTFATYEKNPPELEEDRVPLNARTPSNRTTQSNGVHAHSPDDGFDAYAKSGRGGPLRGVPRGMRGGRGGYGGPRDEYGNPLPPSSAFGPTAGPMSDPSHPSMRHLYSDEGMGGVRGRGRGAYPARGYGRGGPHGPGRGGPNNYGRGAPMGMAAGAGVGLMAGEIRNRGGQGPPPDYGNGYSPMGGQRPGQYEQAGAAGGYGRSPSAPAYGRRSPGPPPAPGFGRQPSPGPPSNPAGYARQASPGPPSNSGVLNRQPSPGGHQARGYGRQSPGFASASGVYARQRSHSNPGGYDHNGRQPSPRAYEGQRVRAESPPPPMPEVPTNEGVIGQAIEMDATTGSPSRTPIPFQPMQLRDSDSDVQGLVGLQRQREHRESPISLTSVYSSQEPYVPPRAAWVNPSSRLNTATATNPSQNVVSPAGDSPITELPASTSRSAPIPQLTSTAPNSNTATQISGHARYNSADTYYEDVDPRFAESTELHPPQAQSSAPLPSALTAGLHPHASQQGVIEHANDPHHNGYLQPSNSYESIPENTHDAGSRSPAISDGSNYTSISQRGINPAWQPPADRGMGMGGVPNRKPIGQQRDALLSSNPDFELPIQGGRPGAPGGRPRAASRGQRQPGMIPGMEPEHDGRYPTAYAF